MTEQMSDSLNLLVRCRERVGISKVNMFVFANSSADGHFGGTDLRREHADKCGAARPDALRSTKFRKQIASATKILNLTRNEQAVTAFFWNMT